MHVVASHRRPFIRARNLEIVVSRRVSRLLKCSRARTDLPEMRASDIREEDSRKTVGRLRQNGELNFSPRDPFAELKIKKGMLNSIEASFAYAITRCRVSKGYLSLVFRIERFCRGECISF